MSEKNFNVQSCIGLLQKKQEEILKNGENRYPKRSDFCEREVNAIKSFLGPWPRALEKAGIKPENKKEKV
jgi:hypothetical protein